MNAKLPLTGKRILCFVGDIYEDLELWYPKLRLIEAGAEVVLAGEKAGVTYAGKHVRAHQLLLRGSAGAVGLRTEKRIESTLSLWAAKESRKANVSSVPGFLPSYMCWAFSPATTNLAPASMSRSLGYQSSKSS